MRFLPPPTLKHKLMIITLILAVSIAIPMGVIAAWKQGTVVDRTVMGFAVLGFSVPVFVVDRSERLLYNSSPRHARLSIARSLI